MIDALLYAVRDGIRATSGMNYDAKTCDIVADSDGRPPPVCGNYFAAIHSATSRSDADNQLQEWYDFTITLTMRVTVPIDRIGDQLMSRNIERVPLAERQGFYAKVERLRARVHMNWGFVVLTGQNPPSANDNLVAWAPDGTTVYGFCEPMRYLGSNAPPVLVGGEWFDAEPESEEVGIKVDLLFGKCRRFQPHTSSPNGPFV